MRNETVWCRKAIIHKDDNKGEVTIRTGFRDMRMTVTAGNPRTLK